MGQPHTSNDRSIETETRLSGLIWKARVADHPVRASTSYFEKSSHQHTRVAPTAGAGLHKVSTES